MTDRRPTDRRDADVVIAGAGIAGLGLACALARYDLRVVLVEPRRAPGGIHRGDSLLPKATRLLARWGVLDAIRAAGARPIDRLEVHHHALGLLHARPLVPEDAAPDPYLVLPHAEIERVLTEAALARGAELIRGARVTGLLRADDRVTGVRLAVRGPDGPEPRELSARLVVGADGQGSAVRRALGIATDAVAYDHAYLGLEADRPTGYADAMRVHLHPDGGVLVMPRHDRVGVGVLVDAGTATRWRAMTDAKLGAVLAERAPLLKGARLRREGAHVYALTRSHAARYHAAGAALLGDAAHTTNPTAGQGMSSALADAGVLAEEVGPALARGHRRLDDALARYEATQRPVNARLVRQSDRLARLYARRGRTWDWLKAGLVLALANPLGERLTAPVLDAFLEPAPAEPDPPPTLGDPPPRALAPAA